MLWQVVIVGPLIDYTALYINILYFIICNTLIQGFPKCDVCELPLGGARDKICDGSNVFFFKWNFF